MSHHINDVFKKFYCGCGYVSTVNEKGKYTKFRTEDDSEGASKCH